MLRHEIVRILRSYEENHPVDEYAAYNWHVWPLLRMYVAYKLQEKRHPEPVRRLLGRCLRASDTLWQGAHRLGSGIVAAGQKLSDSRRHVEPDAPGHPVTILTHSGRRTRKGSLLYETYSDPLAERLRRRDISTLVWEEGRPHTPRHSPSSWITHRLVRDAFSLGLRPQRDIPMWFLDYERWASELLKRPVTWEETEEAVRNLQAMSLVFERWLKSSGSRVLISVCWYNRTPMAATLAARRLGIHTIDLQHGLQGEGHIAYSSWTRGPKTGYETIPDSFWVWGDTDAEEWRKDNPALMERSGVLVGGNLWLNKWRRHDDEDFELELENTKRVMRGYRKSLLVTLQKEETLDTQNAVLDAIRQSPQDWLWLIRLHSKMVRHRGEIERRFRETNHPGIDFEHAGRFSLYSLLDSVDVHMTAFSTCAHEALAFGVPSVVLSPIGREAFGPHIRNGVMFFSDTGPGIIDAVMRCEAVSGDECLSRADGIFAPESVSEAAIDVLLRIIASIS